MCEHASTYRDLLKKLTVKEQKLVHEYLIDGNATRAAKKADYSARSAPEIACQTFRKVKVAAAVEAGLAMLAMRCELSAEKVLRELAAIAFASSYSFAESEDGLLGVADGAAPESGAALQIRHRRIKKDDGSFATETLYIQHDKLRTLELLGKKLKLFVERVEVENAQDEAYRLLLRGIRQERGEKT
jgi:phage terminase small subunit